MDLGNGEIYNDDCIEKMAELPCGSVDMILSDMPYSVLDRQNPGASWDTELPLDELWQEWLRITKENAAIVLFGQGMFTAKLMMSQPKLWRYNLIWDKVASTGFLNANRMPLRGHEDILVFYRRLPVYHPQKRKAELNERNHGRGSKYKFKAPTNNCYGKFKNIPTVISDEKFPRSIVRFSCANRKNKELHPSAKPVDLLRWLIRTYSDEGDLVLDCTAGSMSTAIAAIRENRKYIMIEKDKHFFEVGKKRIEKELKSATFF